MYIYVYMTAINNGKESERLACVRAQGGDNSCVAKEFGFYPGSGEPQKDFARGVI